MAFPIQTPDQIDGAKVILAARGDFCVASDGTRIVALAIARYDDGRQNAVYLFACDCQWNVVGDLLFASIEEAQQGAERDYEVSPIHWERVQ